MYSIHQRKKPKVVTTVSHQVELQSTQISSQECMIHLNLVSSRPKHENLQIRKEVDGLHCETSLSQKTAILLAQKLPHQPKNLHLGKTAETSVPALIR